MEILSPVSYISASNWLFEEKTRWTSAENKAFENALAVFDKDTPDRWHRVAQMVPGKSVLDVMRHYKELEDDVNNIEAGLVPIPGYATAPFTLDWGDGHDLDDFKQFSYGVTGKRSSTRPAEYERKKGVPWTEKEHKLFLMGLKKYGKGDWRNISRNYVMTRTPTQVASHAQKYFMRQLSGGKDKRRASIHDITTISLNDHQVSSLDNKTTPSIERSTALYELPNSTAMHKMPFMWNLVDEGAVMSFDSGLNGDAFMYSPGENSCNVKLQDQNKQRGAMHESYLGCQGTMSQMQAAYQHPHA